MSRHPSKQSPGTPRLGKVVTSIIPTAHARLIGLLLALLTLLLYWPVVHFGFVNYDDGEYFASNSHVLEGLTREGIGWAFSTGFAGNWHPLTWLSLMLDAEVFGVLAKGPHFTNLVLHSANSVLLFILLRRTTGATWRSAAVGALFAVHPLHVESVAWVSERKDVLSTFFGLLALYAYAIHAGSAEDSGRQSARPISGRASGSPLSAQPSFPGSRGAAGHWRGRWCYCLALVCFALGLMSKPMLVTLPFVMLLLDYWPLQRLPLVPAGQFRRQLKRLAWEKLPFFALSGASCAITLLVQVKGGATRPLASLSFESRLENALVSCLRYVGKAVWPTNLAVLYPHPGRWPWGLVIVAVVVLVAGCVAVAWFARRFPYLAVGWFWFLGTLIPVIGLVQVGIQSMADRYMYVPIIGLLILGVWGLGEALAAAGLPKPALTLAATLVVAGFALRTRDQLGYWQDGEKLFRHAVAVTEHNDLALGCLENNLGNSLFRQGQLDEAVDQYRRSIQHFPNNQLAHNNLGIALAAKGDFQGAINQYSEALRLQPDYANAHANLGDALVQEHRREEAIAHYRQALALEPHAVQALNNLGSALIDQGKYSEAVVCCRQVIQLRPDFVGGYDNLAAALLGEAKVEEAAGFLRQALRVDPANARANFLLGTAYSRLGRATDALRQFNQVLRLEPGFPGIQEMIKNLANPGESTNGFH